ncbi:MAG TPA: phosphatase PAP2 family protein [Candidatus Limnocylindrales bacterium]|nr:phosphatase PAP2 family protein [Candidatus Limnocylindrales bacterium]
MSAARAVWGYIETRDHRLMRRVNRWRAPRWIRLWMISATRCGDGWLWYALGIILLTYGGPERFAAVGSAMLAVAIGTVVFKAMKRMSRRKRPNQLEPHCWSRVLPPDQFSFPSGHTITAFAIVMTVGAFYPQLQNCLIICAVSIAISRILLGMHFLSDVVVGGIIGALLGYGCFHLFM